MKITWMRCDSYEEARDYSRIIYLHEWNGKPFYWGKAHNSFFGGSKRKRDGLYISGRYNPGYKHWIEGCLKHGGRLYIGLLDKEALSQIDKVERFLIGTYESQMNSKVTRPVPSLNIEHKGEIPASITNAERIYGIASNRYEESLNKLITDVFARHPEWPDHRKEWPWLTSHLGNPKAGIWFIGENPSLGNVERLVPKHADQYPLTPEAQWLFSRGDVLFRKSLVECGFKEGSWDSLGGWHCYITNVVKWAYYAKKWNKLSLSERNGIAEEWSAVIAWELEQSKPRLIVTMGKKVQRLVEHLMTTTQLRFPRLETIHHYSYIAFRPCGKLGPMHPTRVKDYQRQMLHVADVFRGL